MASPRGSRSPFPRGPWLLLSLVESYRSDSSEQAKHTTVGGFIFLRFFCPAILSPDSTSPPLLTKVDQNLRRTLILISKSLQNLANGLDFGNKEPFMQDMNAFINDNKATVEGFFDNLAVRCDKRADISSSTK